MLGGGAEFYPYPIKQSCRFNDDDTAYLEWLNVNTADTSYKKKTFNTWVKRCNLGTIQTLFSSYYSSALGLYIAFNAANHLNIWGETAGIARVNKESYAVYRDTTAWLNIHIEVDTTLATAEDRVKIFVNNERMTVFSVNVNPTQDIDLWFSGFTTYSIYNLIGCWSGYTSLADHYKAATFFIDGQALPPSSFGVTKYGIWIPRKYTGTYGINGFHLDYANSADLGTDASGNSNDFTSNGLASDDQVLDSPTNNHPTLNGLHHLSTATIANGGLDCSGVENEYATIIIPATGKWGWEITVSENGSFGLEDIDLNEKVAADVSGEVVEMLVDMDAGTLKKKVDGGSLEVIEATLNTDSEWYPYFKAACSVDFGQLGYSPSESGYKTLCSKNLSNPIIKDSSKGFEALPYEGTGAAQDIEDLIFDISAGGLVAIKNRDQADNHRWVDTVRGSTKEIYCDLPNVEGINANGFTGFLSNGFSLGTGAGGYNDFSENFIAWCFRMGSRYGFDIQAYVGTGVAHAESHDLVGIPELIHVKNLTVEQPWVTYHHHAANKTDPETDYGVLSSDGPWYDDVIAWNDTAPTSTQFSLGTGIAVNQNGSNFIAYLWRSIEGFSKVFSYTGNANVDGPFVWCDFKPAFILYKNINTTQSWIIFDVKRSTYNVVNDWLATDLNSAEGSTAGIDMDILSNGFKIRGTHANINGSGNTIVGIAYAEQPGKYSNAR